MISARNVYRNVRQYDDSVFELDVYGLAFQWDRLSPPACGWSFDLDNEDRVFRFEPETNVFEFEPGDC